MVPSPEEDPIGHGIPNHKEFPEVNGLSDSDEDPNREQVPDFDGIPSDEETSDAEEIPDHEEASEVNGVVELEETPNPEEVPALHVVTDPENTSDSGEIQGHEESSEVSGAPNNEEASNEEIQGHEEASGVSGNQDSEENPDLEGYSVMSAVPEPEYVQIHSEIPDLKRDRVGAFDEDEVSMVDPGTEDASILSTISDPPQDVLVNLEDVMNVKVPVPEDLNSKEIQNQKAIWFKKDGADTTFPVGTTLLKNKSLFCLVMGYMSFQE